MWRFPLVVVSAVLAAFIQAIVLANLRGVFVLISIPLAVIAYELIVERPLEAALWACFAGVCLDAHGVSGFGTQTTALFAAFAAGRFLHRRVLTNRTALATFVLSALAVAVHGACLILIDGVRILFGGVPYLLVSPRDLVLRLMLSAAANGLLVLAVIRIRDAAGRRFRQTFISTHAFRA